MQLNQKLKELLNRDRNKINSTLLNIYNAVKAEARTAFHYRKLEAQKYIEFVEIVKKEKAKYFSFELVDKLNLDYDILIVTGEKGTGKTRSVYRKMLESYKKGEKFIFMRSTKGELDSNIPEVNIDSNCSFYALPYRSNYYFFNKVEYEAYKANNVDSDDPTPMRYSDAIKWGVPVAGYATSLRDCNKTAGGNFEGYRHIFIDEFISWINLKLLNEAAVESWTAYPSSIARNKDWIKIYFTGNLKKANSELLDYYEIDARHKFRYILRGFKQCSKCKDAFGDMWTDACFSCSDCSPPCRIIYINIEKIFGGISKQCSTVKHASPRRTAVTLSNSPVFDSGMIIEEDTYYLFDFLYRFAVFVPGYKIPKVIEVRKGKTEKFKSFLSTRVVDLEGHLKISIKTDNLQLKNSFINVHYVVSLEPHIRQLYLYYRKANLYYYDLKSLEVINAYFATYQA